MIGRMILIGGFIALSNIARSHEGIVLQIENLAAGSTNVLEYTSDLPPPATWTTLSSFVPETPATNMIDLNPSAPIRFYRVREQTFE